MTSRRPASRSHRSQKRGAAAAVRRVVAAVSLPAWLALGSCAAAGAEPGAGVVLTNVAQVRELSPEQAAGRLAVRITGVVTFVFDRGACFVQDETAGIYVGTGGELPDVSAGDYVLAEGETGPGEYAPIVRPSAVQVLGRTNLPTARRVSYEDLITGREDSQWVEVAGLVRAAAGDPASGGLLEIATGGGRLVAFVPSLTESNLSHLVDSRVRARGVCGTWFNRLRQLFGVRLMVPSVAEIVIEEPAATNAFEQAAVPIAKLLQFAPSASYGRRVKVAGTVILQQPGRALFIQDDGHGLYAQTRQRGSLAPGDQIELLGFPAVGDYTPMLQDATWRRTGAGPEPKPRLVWPDEALSGFHDCQLVQIEGRLLNRSQNNRQAVLVLESDQQIFSAILDAPKAGPELPALQTGSRLRLTGVCRIEVGSDWRAGQAWRAKSFQILLRTAADVQVLAQPPWWTLTRLLWAVGVLGAVGLGALAWAGALRRRVSQQTQVIRQQLDTEATLKERYQDLFENANDMVYTTDLDGRLTSINAAGERVLQQTREKLTQMSLLDLIAEEQRPAALQWLAQVRSGQVPPTAEWDFLGGPGQRLRLEISTRLIEHHGKTQEVEGIARDVTERRRLEKEILEISTREQRRIGHDLHDGVCQRLAGMAFIADTLAEKLDEGARPEAAEAHKLTDLLNDTNRQTRGVARGLFPVRLEENGLVSALEELAASTSSYHGTRCEFQSPTPINVRDPATAHHLYYIAQEAMLNAARHGRASLVRVQLAEDGPRGVLTVQDNGIGLPQGFGRGPGMGIRIMEYRARMIGAELEVRRRQQSGTEVICRFPRPQEP
jgi:PAS domain S-box-containing protein